MAESAGHMILTLIVSCPVAALISFLTLAGSYFCSSSQLVVAEREVAHRPVDQAVGLRFAAVHAVDVLLRG